MSGREEIISEQTIIIDGYNLLRRAFRFFEEEHGLEAARAKLEVRLREFLRARGPGLSIVLVYDGAEGMSPPETPAHRPTGGLQVVFSRPPQSADDLILEECAQRRGREALTVVTSDRKDIQARLRGPRLHHFTSEEFAEALEQAMGRPQALAEAGGPAASPAEKPSPEDLSAGEVAEWLRIFSQPKRRGRAGSPDEDRE